jgi:hypothetical protein
MVDGAARQIPVCRAERLSPAQNDQHRHTTHKTKTINIPET